MSRRSASGNLHIQLDSVHSKNCVTKIRQKVGARFEPAEGWHLLQFFQLSVELLLVTQIDVGSEFDDLGGDLSYSFFSFGRYGCDCGLAALGRRLSRVCFSDVGGLRLG